MSEPSASSGQSELFKSTINEYLDNLPETIHLQLYRSPETCLAVFRLLPSLAKFYIMTMLFQDAAIPSTDLNRWIKSSSFNGSRNLSKIYQNDSLKRLKALNLLKETRRIFTHPQTGQTTQLPFVSLNPTFRQSFRNALTGSRDANEVVEDNNLESIETISVEFLDTYCLHRWESILHFMVGSETKELPSVGVLTLLRYSGLMELPSDREQREHLGDDYEFQPKLQQSTSIQTLKNLLITQNGFQFLLQDINSQIWTLLLQYLKMSEKLMMNPVEVLNFIFMLGSLELGQGYPVDPLSDTQKIMLDDLIDYGLIYTPSKTNKKIFYPTRLATTLTSEHTNFKTSAAVIDQEIANSKNSNNQGTIVVETNFKIYCYTSSPLQIAILNLFVHLKARFANMVTGVITRESVRRALINGITADQMINYLSSHAHPWMVKQAEDKLARKLELESSIGNAAGQRQVDLEILPPTVVDQIKLWQLELDRIQSFKGYLYKDFSTDLEFEKLLTYGEEIGVIVWKDRTRKRFFVTQEGNGQLLDYANRIIRGNS
ncbi:hypothetical protein KL907_000990 [Ogataea polymorpha]|nr:hypothetical protein KL907_000990 [Ogataea polymorpha]